MAVRTGISAPLAKAVRGPTGPANAGNLPMHHASSHEISCTERERLIEQYRSRVERFRDAVLALKALRGAAFDRVYRYSEFRRTAVEEARIALEKHRQGHHC